MDRVEFLKGLFSFSIIIPASIMCYLPMKNQLKFSVKKNCFAFGGGFCNYCNGIFYNNGTF